LPGLLVGLLAGLLITVPQIRLASAPSDPQPVIRHADIESLSAAELETLALETLSTLREKRRLNAAPDQIAENSFAEKMTNSWPQVQLGLKNIRRLLPLAKLLTLDALRTAQTDGRLKSSGLLKEKRLLQGVRTIVLDSQLIGDAEVWGDRLSEIRVATDYAPALISDDEAIFVLGHELTHVAARSGRLKSFIDKVKQTASLSADVEPTGEQQEDLACDYTAALVLKRFIMLYPTGETEKERFSRIIGFEPPSERLALAWEDFCASYNGVSGDEDHLSKAQTMRALVGLDPELKALVPDDALTSMLCREDGSLGKRFVPTIENSISSTQKEEWLKS
jgi:hypothetical protein